MAVVHLEPNKFEKALQEFKTDSFYFVDACISQGGEVLSRAMKFCFCIALLVPSIPFAGLILPTVAGEGSNYRYAYYLFLAGTPKGCEDCYIPLLITHDPLERVTKTKQKDECVLIITYERDSIWQNDGIVSVSFNDIEVAPRIIHLRNKKYRYQEVGSGEVLKILQNPMGTIPISRPLWPNASSPGPKLEELILDFREPN